VNYGIVDRDQGDEASAEEEWDPADGEDNDWEDRIIAKRRRIDETGVASDVVAPRTIWYPKVLADDLSDDTDKENQLAEEIPKLPKVLKHKKGRNIITRKAKPFPVSLRGSLANDEQIFTDPAIMGDVSDVQYGSMTFSGLNVD